MNILLTKINHNYNELYYPLIKQSWIILKYIVYVATQASTTMKRKSKLLTFT